MKELKNFFTPLHKKTSRNYLARMEDEKISCMIKAKQYGYDYWDGDRRFGYGGYLYDGRWKSVAEQIVREYSLTNKSRVLDVGCGKAHLLFEIQRLLPDAELIGFDISKYGLETAPKEIQTSLHYREAQSDYPWADNYFDLVISLGCLHNLQIFDLKKALIEIERVGKEKYCMTESYRSEEELFNLQCWALTCESFFSFNEWKWLFSEFGYSGDYEFIYFE